MNFTLKMINKNYPPVDFSFSSTFFQIVHPFTLRVFNLPLAEFTPFALDETLDDYASVVSIGIRLAEIRVSRVVA